MDTVAVIAGQTITVGIIASFLTQFLKNAPWFPVNEGDTVELRGVVALLCLAINVGTSYVTTHQVPELQVVLMSLMSYFAASANYVHIIAD